MFIFIKAYDKFLEFMSLFKPSLIFEGNSKAYS